MSGGRKQKMFRAGVAAVCALAFLVGAAQAGAIPGTATITGGSLAMTTPTAVAFSASLTGVDQTTDAAQAIDVIDSRGTGAGWNVTLTSTTFTGTPGSLPDNSVTDAAASGGCDAGVSCTLADNTTVGYPVTVPSAGTAPTAVKILTAGVGTGLGGQTWTHTMRLALPASVKAGTYNSEWTYSLVSGP